MSLLPDFEAFADIYRAGRPQILFRRLVADLETPVSAFLKLGEGQENAFLLESVQGGETRGRYSIIGLRPDLIWRCRGDVAEINHHALGGGTYVAEKARPLESLRALIQATRMDLPAGLPPMATGLFGYLGYDMVRQIEHLPNMPPDRLGLPDAILLRPTIIAIFDTVKDEIVVVTPIWPDPAIDARSAHARALERIEDAVVALDRPLPPNAEAPAGMKPESKIESNMTRDEYFSVVNRAKDYIKAGDIFQVVPSQRFRRPFELPPFSLYRALRRLNPSPFLYYLSFPGFSIVGSSPEILVRLRDGKVTIRPIAGTRPRGATPEKDVALAEELMADPKERAEHLMLLDLGRNDVGRVARIGAVKVTGSFFIERYSHVMHLVSNVEGDIRPGLDAVDALARFLRRRNDKLGIACNRPNSMGTGHRIDGTNGDRPRRTQPECRRFDAIRERRQTRLHDSNWERADGRRGFYLRARQS